MSTNHESEQDLSPSDWQTLLDNHRAYIMDLRHCTDAERDNALAALQDVVASNSGKNELRTLWKSLFAVGLGEFVAEYTSGQAAKISEYLLTTPFDTFLDAVTTNPDQFNSQNDADLRSKYLSPCRSTALLNSTEPIHFINPLFRKLEIDPTEPLGVIAANVGHDVNKLGLFTFENRINHQSLLFYGNDDLLTDDRFYQYIYQTFPGIFSGTVSILDCYRKWFGDKSMENKDINMTALLNVLLSEAASRILMTDYISGTGIRTYIDVGTLVWNNQEFQIRDPNAISILHQGFRLVTKIAPGLIIRGDQSYIHLALYQQMKNTVSVLRESTEALMPCMEIAAGQIELCKGDKIHPICAVRISDNGPGIDMSELIRTKQQALQEYGIKNQSDNVFANEWVCLDVRIRDVINIIFERRISGSTRKYRHSGLGLDIAMQCIGAHGAIWVTNLYAKEGTKFLFLFDADPNGSMKDEYPDLVPQNGNPVPADILLSIDRQLDQIPPSFSR